jgi:hypothetical protein
MNNREEAVWHSKQRKRLASYVFLSDNAEVSLDAKYILLGCARHNNCQLRPAQFNVWHFNSFVAILAQHAQGATVCSSYKRYTMADTAPVPWRLFVKKFIGQFESKNIW